jgi:flagellar biosynthesis/type III secretory pathway protein FliH
MGLASATDRKHRYQACRDEECEFPYCRIYREGYADGHEAGTAAGYAAGRADGYAEGYAEGYAAGGE